VGCALEGGERARRRGRWLVFTFGRDRETFRVLCVLFLKKILNNIIFFNMRKQILTFFFINFIIYKT
jgi:hypothetical protein